MHKNSRDETYIELGPEPETELTALADSLAEMMAEAWHRGERPVVEELFAEHPHIAENPESAVQLIYEEITLRREYLFEPTEAEILSRFPRWQKELAILLACDRLVQPDDLARSPTSTRVPREWPEVGSRLGGFHLLAILGTGTMGRTFLASDPDLADRPVVLKITARGLGEHISLARLQHTNVVPLYAAPDFPDKDLRALCMPYLGGTTLDRLFTQIRLHEVGRPTGNSIIEAIDRLQEQLTVSVEVRKQGAARRVLEQLSYADAIAWIALQLAEALADAHERGLVHMDVKPANVLIAADGTPMLLDFHLAREPIRPNSKPPTWVGGTPHAMPPEQRAAMTAVREHRPITVAVDGRADIYALGRLMEEAFDVPRGGEGVTTGLRDIIARCVKDDPDDRYPDANQLAKDLKRHLNDEPLVGVRNRSLAERWTKWQRRRPYGLMRLILGLITLVGVIGFGFLVVKRSDQAKSALNTARNRLSERNFVDAIRSANEGLAVANTWPFGKETRKELQKVLLTATEVQSARELNVAVEQLRYLVGVDPSTVADPQLSRPLKVRDLWNKHKVLTKEGHLSTERRLSNQVVDDLRDLVVLGSKLNKQSAKTADEKEAARLEENVLLQESERLLGPAPENSAGRHYGVGLDLFGKGDFPAALAAFDRAIEVQPNHFRSNFHHGLTAFRLAKFDDAVSDFSACIALAPKSADCFYNRALVFTELNKTDRAMRDYQIALKLNPRYFKAALNAALLSYGLQEYDTATVMLDKAIANRTEDDSQAIARLNQLRDLLHKAKGSPRLRENRD